MTVYIDAIYLFNIFIKKTASQQAVKFHVGNFPGGSKSIVANKYNVIIDSILSVANMFEHCIDKLKQQFDNKPIELIIPQNFTLSTPIEYSGRTWCTRKKRYIPLQTFVYYLGCDIKECLKAYENVKTIIADKLITCFSNSDNENIMEYKASNADWPTLIRKSPQSIDTKLTDIFLNKKERKQLRLIYYNEDILLKIYDIISRSYPSINKHNSNSKYTQAKYISYYTKNIKYKIAFTQARLTDEEIKIVFNYVISCLNIPIETNITDNSFIVSDINLPYGTATNITYYSYTNNEIIKRSKQPQTITTLTNYEKQNKNIVDIIKNINSNIPIIDIDPDRHLEIFIEYPQNVLYADNFDKSLITNYNWKTLKQGLNSDILLEYISNVNMIINRFKFKYFVFN